MGRTSSAHGRRRDDQLKQEVHGPLQGRGNQILAGASAELVTR
jgi:hypothetical protein